MMEKSGGYIALFGRRIHWAWVILIGCCFVQAGGVGTILLSAGVFYLPICDELGFARSELSLWMTAYFLATIPATPLASKLFLRFNIRWPMAISIVVLAVAVGLMSTYTQVWQWIASGAVIGAFGACVLMMPSAAMIGNWFAKKAGLAMGISACSSAFAGAILSPLYQWVISSQGWRTAYLVEAGIILAFCLPWALLVFHLKPKDIGARAYGIGDGNIKDIEKSLEKTPAALVKDISYKRALCSVSFVMLFIVASFSAFIGSGFDPHMPGIAVSFGFDPAFGALLLSALQMGSFSDKFLMGFLNDKLGVQKTIYIEFFVVALGILGLIVFRQPALLLLSAFLFGVQDSLVSVSIPLLVRQIFGIANYVQLYAWLRVGIGIFGSFASVLVGLSYDVSSSFLPVLTIALILAILGAGAVTVAYRFRRNLCEHNSIDGVI